MSHRIVYEIKAIRFPFDELNNTNPNGKKFYEDQYILLELGGDNNVWSSGRNPKRPRSWDAIAYGSKWRVMQRVAELSAVCEGGSMRFYGKNFTYPESYIRRIRNIVNKADKSKPSCFMGFSLGACLELTSEIAAAATIEKLDAVFGVKQTGNKKCWAFPLGRMDYAAMFFAYAECVDERNAWNIIKVNRGIS